MELRSPADVANLAFIFGLNEQQGKEAVRGHCLRVYRTAVGRKMGPYRVRIEKLPPAVAVDSDAETTENMNDSSDGDKADSPVAMVTG
jgi:ribonuclease P/MRP protein subunit RPP1